MFNPSPYISYPLNTFPSISNQYPSQSFLNHFNNSSSPKTNPKDPSIDTEKESIDSLSNSNSTTIETPLSHNEHAICLNKVMNTLLLSSTDIHKDVIAATKIKNDKQVKMIYEKSKNAKKDRSQYKIVHKCSYPGCSRLFTSSGWLRAHFGEHLKDIRKMQFNVLFDKMIYGIEVKH